MVGALGKEVVKAFTGQLESFLGVFVLLLFSSFFLFLSSFFCGLGAFIFDVGGYGERVFLFVFGSGLGAYSGWGRGMLLLFVLLLACGNLFLLEWGVGVDWGVCFCVFVFGCLRA